MLKRFFFGSIAALVLLFCICLVNSRHLSHITDNLAEKASVCYEQTGWAAEDGKSVKALNTCWEKERGYLEMTLPHVEVEAVGQAIAEFAGALKTEDENEYTRAYYLLCEKLSHLKMIDSLSVRNIL